MEAEVADFLEDEAWEVTFEDDPDPPGTSDGYFTTDPNGGVPDRPWQLARYRLYRDPPLDLTIHASEIFAQWASALDHLMTELAALRSSQMRKHPEHSPNFPIHPDPGSFWVPDAQTGRVPADSVRGYVRDYHFTALERLQPKDVQDMHSTAGKLSRPNALAILKRVNNFNKHATVRAAYVGVRRYAVRADANVPGFQPIYVPGAALYDKAPLYRAVFVAGPEMGVPMTIEPALSSPSQNTVGSG